MPVTKCPRCGREVIGGLRECPHCGVVFAKYRAPKSRPSSRNSEQRPPASGRSGLVTGPSSTPLFSRGFLIIIVILAAVGAAYAWYYYYGPCGLRRINHSMSQLQQIAERWDDANSIAGSAARIALAAPVSDLQKIKREANELGVPGCLAPAKRTLLASMEASIDAYLAFMQRNDDLTVSTKMLLAETKKSTFASELRRVSDCAPYCPDLGE